MKKNVEIKRIRSPYYFAVAGGVFIIGTFLRPMYKLSSYILLLALALIVYIVLRVLNVFKDDVIEIEIPVEYENEQVSNLVTLAQGKIIELKELTQQIDKMSLVNDLNSIIDTSEAILQLLIEHQDLEKKTKKYFRYYLDEIIHIVKQYDEIEDDPLNVDNIATSKTNIEKTVHNAKDAFIKFYNDLNEGRAMDIDVDLKVFDDMLKQLD